jgi:hypothetical protein
MSELILLNSLRGNRCAVFLDTAVSEPEITLGQSKAKGPASSLVHYASLCRAVEGFASGVWENQRRRYVVLNTWKL